MGKKVLFHILLIILVESLRPSSTTTLDLFFKTGQRRLITQTRNGRTVPDQHPILLHQPHPQTMDLDSLALMRSPSASLMALTAFSLSTLACSMTSLMSFSSGSTFELAGLSSFLSSDETSSGALQHHIADRDRITPERRSR
jgi:hypothetical protein